MNEQRYCFALDLKPDEDLISKYEAYHQQVWPEVLASVRNAGIRHMEIYRFAARLFMVMELSEDFSFEMKKAMDETNNKVRAWELLMWKYQQAIPGTAVGEKWVRMEKIFSL